MIDLSIITITYNNRFSINKYLKSVLNSLPANSEIILIDNASLDETILLINKFNDKRIKLFKQSKNLGFSKAYNLGAKYAEGKYLLFLNPDVEIVNDAIKKILDIKLNNPEFSLVVPKLILPNGAVQASVRRLPTLVGAFKEYILNRKYAYQEYFPKVNYPQKVECAYGAVMLIAKNLFEKVKGFDERYFLYYEDIELCRKLKKMNKSVVYVPNVSFKHLLGSSKTIVSEISGFKKIVSFFIPLEKDTREYYIVQSRNLYHGFLTSFLITLTIFIAQKFRK